MPSYKSKSKFGVFQPTLPLRGATPRRQRSHIVTLSFNPRSPCGERRLRRLAARCPGCFNPRSPCGERRSGTTDSTRAARFQPTLPLRGATRRRGAQVDVPRVSTHAPLAGSDAARSGLAWDRSRFNPRSPCGERRIRSQSCLMPRCFNPRSPCGERRYWRKPSASTKPFQPTLPLRGATRLEFASNQTKLFQPTLPLRGATYWYTARGDLGAMFQPTLPLRGATSGQTDVNELAKMFQPTLPLRGATPDVSTLTISEGSFNPRSPCGERPLLPMCSTASRWFQPTLPLRGATRGHPRHARQRAVSTHAPLAGSDCYILLM